MKRILMLLVALALIAAVQPTPGWSTPPRQQEYSPGDCSNSGDDDEPFKSGSGATGISFGDSRDSQGVESPSRAPSDLTHEEYLPQRMTRRPAVLSIRLYVLWISTRSLR